MFCAFFGPDCSFPVLDRTEFVVDYGLKFSNLQSTCKELGQGQGRNRVRDREMLFHSGTGDGISGPAPPHCLSIPSSLELFFMILE